MPIILANSQSDFPNKIADAAADGINWANTVGLAIIASIMVISIIRFLFDKG